MPFWKKKKPPAQDADDFHTKVDAFWKWFESRSQYFLDQIDAGKCGDLQPEISKNVNAMWPSFAWVFGPPPEGKNGHSFTLSGEGLIERQFLTEEWLRRAPEIENWTFYASRQPGDVQPQVTMEIGENSFEFGGFWVSPVIDEENELVDITAWHPSFETAEENIKSTALFLMLDEILGEYGVDTWLGVIETSDAKLAEAMPALELRDFLHDLEVERGWKKYPPPESYSLYQLPEPTNTYLRGDTVSGTSSNMKLVGKYLNNHGPVENDLEGSGAEFLFIAFDSGILPDGEQVIFRGEIEDALDSALRAESAGHVTGGAIGQQFTYIDVINFRGAGGRALLEQAIVAKGLPESTAIHQFTE